MREWVADLCGLSPRHTSFLFLESGYDPHVVRQWLFRARDTMPERNWESGKTRAPSPQEQLSEKMKELRHNKEQTGTVPSPPKRESKLGIDHEEELVALEEDGF